MNANKVTLFAEPAEPATEYWLRGPVTGIIPGLQPVAHALLQARMEIESAMNSFNSELLWVMPLGMASTGFHLRHLAGVLDRLFTYARGEVLSTTQLDYLANETVPPLRPVATGSLVNSFSGQVDLSLAELSNYLPADLYEVRAVGRKKLHSTVLGLLFHAAEHTMRHTGSLLVISRIAGMKSTI